MGKQTWTPSKTSFLLHIKTSNSVDHVFYFHIILSVVFNALISKEFSFFATTLPGLIVGYILHTVLII